METIADHWVRKNVQTAKEAMELARQEHDKYTAWKNKPQTSNKTSQQTKGRSRYQREEKVPEWFYKRNDNQEESTSSTIDFEKSDKNIRDARKKRIVKKVSSNRTYKWTTKASN